VRVITQGLVKLGLLKGRVPSLEKDGAYRKFFMHRTGHWLGMDVHDCAQARAETYKFGQLEAGMVLTVEPGLYFQTDDLTVPARFRGIGVRIEDDVVVTAKGMRNLSADIPSEAAAVEGWMAKVWKSRGKRSRA
jgi:Xaa-Pro aminopeptidase